MKFKRFVICLFFIASYGFAEENNIYYIKNIQCDIDGSTKEFVVLDAAQIRISDEIQGESALFDYIQDRTRLLNNYRIFESASLEYKEAEKDNDGRIPLDITIRVKDTRNLIIFPEPKYSSSSGFEPSIKMRHYNFLGRNTVLRTEFGYGREEDNEASYSKDNLNFELNVDIPFIAMGYKWNIKFENNFKYFFNEAAEYKNTTGISMDIPIRQTILTFGYNHGTTINEEYYLYEKINYNKNVKDIWYMTSSIFGAWKMPAGIKTKILGELVYTPSITGSINYSDPEIELEEHKGVEIIFSQRLGFNHIDWIGNFRKGGAVYAENTNKYNIYFNEWLNDIALTAIGHFIPANFLGISSRAAYKHWFDKNGILEDRTRWKAAEYLRGINDNAITPQKMLILNTDIDFLLFTFMTSKIFNNEKLKLLDFDFHLGAFFDFAFIDGIQVTKRREKQNDITFSFDDIFITGGIEAKIFPLSFRSIFLRFSIGWNIRKAAEDGALPSGNNREIYIGIGNYY
ncbi:hypothetical protein AGMMS50212_07700 [Spirochaetia bacterium]|nr:hypothetical protein AGMMS50212_07700 [Spirochaetia bacterium]